MQWRFCLWQFPFQPNTQSVAELGRRFICEPLAHAEEFDPTLKFGDSFRRLFQLDNLRLQLSQPFFDQFCLVQGLVLGSVLERCLVVFPICFACPIHALAPLMTSVSSF